MKTGSLGSKPSLRNAWCDCIRGYAILLVCCEHLLHVEPVSAHLGFITHYFKGDTGVFMFYVLSGFLVTGILAREVSGQEKLRPRLNAMGHFFARRIFRLQPSYLLFLGIYALMPAREGALSWWVLLFPFSNWFAGPYITWHIKTLHVEETYYLFIGSCSGVFWRSLKPLLWAMLVLGPVGRGLLFVLVKNGSETAGMLLDRYLPIEAFALGGLLSLYLPTVLKSRPAQMITLRPVLSFALAMLALLTVAALRPIKPFSYGLLLTWPLIFSALSAVMILSGLAKERFFFSAEWLRKLGLVSYTVYLFQQFALGSFSQNFGTSFSWTRWGGVALATAILLPPWYLLVEKPITDLGAWRFPRLSKLQGSPSAHTLQTQLRQERPIHQP